MSRVEPGAHSSGIRGYNKTGPTRFWSKLKLVSLSKTG